MKVKNISYVSGSTDDYLRVITEDGEIVYISIESIISLTIKTNGDVSIICIHSERYLLQNVDKELIESLLEFGETANDDEDYEDDF